MVTGGASGIGAATARRFAAVGARVAVVDRDPEGAATVADEIGGSAHALDVRDGDAVELAVAQIMSALGRVDVLVNNAGTGDLRPLHTVDDKLWHRLIDVNLTGTFNAMRSVVPHMLAGGGGTIVNNASLSGLLPTRNEAAYSAAKAGVIALTKSGALEYGPSVRVNCVAPGHIRTPLTIVWEQMPDAFAPIADSIPLGRIGEADEVAEVILFLASDRSSYVTGQTLVVDGGAMLPQAGTDAALAKLFERLQ
jgi:NAD(P)-dependent dehydrogenase (short-subunit alcohol dehydrogenase family)